MTPKGIRYTVFETSWGHFGLAYTGDRLCRTFLPVPQAETVREALLRSLGPAAKDAKFEAGLARDFQARIAAYFEGENVDFSADPAVDLSGRGPFERMILEACRQIPAGETRTYTALAEGTGRHHAARAVGNAMAGNPVPLIVPCHRVVRADGGLGGFSAPGGIATKERMLRHEQLLRVACPSSLLPLSGVHHQDHVS